MVVASKFSFPLFQASIYLALALRHLICTKSSAERHKTDIGPKKIVRNPAESEIFFQKFCIVPERLGCVFPGVATKPAVSMHRWEYPNYNAQYT